MKKKKKNRKVIAGWGPKRPYYENDRLETVHKSLAGMSAYAATLLQRIAELEKRIEGHLSTIRHLTQLLEESETAIVRAAAGDIGGSCTGRSAPIQKTTERQPKESLPTQERLVRTSQTHTRETPGNAPLLDAADNPASRSIAENPR